MSTETVIYDDRNPSISYSGEWSQAGISPEYMNTTSWTSQNGATASLTFSGTTVSVWGTISNFGSAPLTSYSIDGITEGVYNATLLAFIQYGRPFFQSKQLTPGSHTLVITMLSETVENAQLFLDYILVTPDTTTSSFASSTLAQSLSTIAPSPSRTVSSIATTLFATISPVHSSKNTVSLRLIIGGALGGLVLLTFAFILWRKNKDRAYERSPASTNNASSWIRVPRANTGINPFQMPIHPLPDPGRHYEPVCKGLPPPQYEE